MSEDTTESEVELRPQPPTGEARKVHELTREQWREHLILLSKVDNEVLEINPNFQLPFKLERGKPSPLGLFAEAAFANQFKEKPLKIPEERKTGEFWSGHARSLILGRVIFADNDGHLYRDVDLKGTGFVTDVKMGKRELPRIYPSGQIFFERMAGGQPGQHGGFVDEYTANVDFVNGEMLNDAGIRTCRVLAIIELKELRPGVSVGEFKKTGDIDEDFRPVIEFRAFGTRARVADCVDNKEGKLLFEDAKKLVSQETGLEFSSDEDYLRWFAETLGKNVGLIHRNKWKHGNLTDHNITLDCRIVDLDSINELVSEEDRKRDFENAENSLGSLISSVTGNKVIAWEIRAGRAKENPILNLYKKSYETTLHQGEVL